MTLRKPGRETDLEVKKWLNTNVSPSFCMAKWRNATIWLGSGMTTSCHHPPAHEIDVTELQSNPAAIHNTLQKKQDRTKMLAGERPAGCEYCWKIEDIGPDAISDRVHKSVIYDEEDVNYVKSKLPTENFALRTLEAAFDRTCNFSCSYCNPAFSSSWVKDIKKDGPYKNLISDGRNHFTHTHPSAQLYKKDETNPYVEAFWKWWDEELHDTLDELRITGGEPLMADDIWKLFERFKTADKKPNMRLAINSNLGAKDELIDRLIENAQHVPHLHLYTSCEAMGVQAEYIRDGLEWNRWVSNCHRVCTDGNLEGFHMMCTINALCLNSLPEFLQQQLEFKEIYGADFPTFTLNILRFPSFQSPLVLPKDILAEFRADIETWYNKAKNNKLMHEMERNHVERLLDYLDVVETPHSDTFEKPALHNDFYHFYKQYDERRGKNFTETFPRLADWYNNLNG